MPQVGTTGEMQKTPDFCEHIKSGKYSLLDYEDCPECLNGKRINRFCGQCGRRIEGDDYCVH